MYLTRKLPLIAIMPFALLLINACETNGETTVSSPNSSSRSISDETRNSIALCGGGMSSATKAELSAKVEVAKRSGNLSASLKDEIRAIIFSDDVFESDAAKNIAYKDFLQCVK